MPVVGEAIILVQAIYDALKGVNLANKLANVAWDLFDVPSTINYQAKWPVVIEQLVPSAINKDKVTDDINLIIEGKGFFTLDGLFPINPIVQVKDTKGTTDQGDDEVIFEKQTSALNLVSDGSAIDFLLLDKDKILNATGPLKVFVELSDAKPFKELPFVDGIVITKVNPDSVFPGMTVEIDGEGFSKVNTDNTVTLQGTSGRVQATIISAIENRLTIIIPNGVVSGDLKVSVGGEDAKNGYPIIVKENGMTVRFGDNGNEQDDIFTILVDGESLQMAQKGIREVELFKNIRPGEYSVKMTANDIPDERGTFYICFSDNIEVLNGSPLTAKTLLTKNGDQASWNIRVSSGIGGIISNCSQSDIKPSNMLSLQYGLID